MSNPETVTLEDYDSQNKHDYPVYSEYQNFHGEWLSEIPAHWDTERFRSNLDHIKGNKPSELEDTKSSDNDVPYLSMEYLREEISSPKFASSEEEGLVTAAKNDILLLWDGSKAGEFVKAKEGVVSSTMAKLSLNEENNPDYIYYQLKIVEDFLQNTTVGMGIPHVNPQILNNIRLVIPPKEEQDSIANFLDKKVRIVDDLINKKRGLIKLLNEKRSVLITEAVTQGIDSDTGLKDSEVPGLGQIPKNWDTAPLKYSSRNVTVGIVSKPSQYYVDDGVPALRSLNVKKNKIIRDELVYISEKSNNELRSSQINSGDLVSVRSGDPGTTAVVPEELDGANCIDLIIVREPDGYIPEFLSFLMNSEASTSQIEAGTEGAALQHFNVGEVKELVFPKPSLNEQRETLDWLSPRLKEIDEMTAKIQEGIERLKEYRSALITEAVTGQIDVRGEV